MQMPPPFSESPALRSLALGMALAACCAGLAGCSSPLRNVSADSFKPYVPEVVQGNFVSREQRQALRLGMQRTQVRDILGTLAYAQTTPLDGAAPLLDDARALLDDVPRSGITQLNGPRGTVLLARVVGDEIETVTQALRRIRALWREQDEGNAQIREMIERLVDTDEAEGEARIVVAQEDDGWRVAA